MSNATTSNGHTQRKQLSAQLDRLDVILDGLADALNESVASAVRDVGQVVRESVESTIREVLSSPDLLRASLAAHGPPPRPGRPCFEGAKNALAALVQQAREAAGRAKAGLASAWPWARAKVCRAARPACGAGRALWRFRAAATLAVATGVLSGAGAYHAGPAIAGALCGLGGAALAAGGVVLWPVYRLLRGGANA